MTTHRLLPESQMHEPKGATVANAGEVYIADGAGSGAWTLLSTLTDVNGWAYYKDDTTAQTFTTTPTKLTIDGLGSTTETSYLPSGVAGLWDSTGNIITPENVGDSYNIRLDLPITNVSGSATELTVQLDIGGGATPSTVIFEQTLSIASGSGTTASVTIGLFSLATFVANGGQIFLNTDANTVDITAPAIFIDRVNKG